MDYRINVFWAWFLEIRSEIYHRGQIHWLSVLFVCNFDNACVAACSPTDGEEKRNCFVFLCVCRHRTSELGWHSWEKPNAKLMLFYDGLTWVPCFLRWSDFNHERRWNLLEQKIVSDIRQARPGVLGIRYPGPF